MNISNQTGDGKNVEEDMPEYDDVDFSVLNTTQKKETETTFSKTDESKEVPPYIDSKKGTSSFISTGGVAKNILVCVLASTFVLLLGMSLIIVIILTKVDNLHSEIRTYSSALADKIAALEDEVKKMDNKTKTMVNKPGLYNFSSHIFTTCEKGGYEGPTLEMCRLTYKRNEWTKDNFFTMKLAGVQEWMVPRTAHYRVTAYGAKGGSGNNYVYSGGRGAKIEGTFLLVQGTSVNIVCGQKGSNGKSSEPGGGGGGTFVYIRNIGGDGLLIAAGGGGGAGEENTHDGYDGQSFEFSYNANGLCATNRNGYGGLGGIRTIAGAGWKSSGDEMTGFLDDGDGKPGTRWVGGNILGAAAGGFGGGGSGCKANGGGGGGGFSGGSGTSNSNETHWGGGGAGSYNSGLEQNNEMGQNDGDGYVLINAL